MVVVALWVMLLLSMVAVVAYQGLQAHQWRSTHHHHGEQARLSAISASLSMAKIARERIFPLHPSERSAALAALGDNDLDGISRILTMDAERNIHVLVHLTPLNTDTSLIRIVAIAAMSDQLPDTPSRHELLTLFRQENPFFSDPHYVRAAHEVLVRDPAYFP